MAASDYVPKSFNNPLRFSGRPQKDFAGQGRPGAATAALFLSVDQASDARAKFACQLCQLHSASSQSSSRKNSREVTPVMPISVTIRHNAPKRPSR